MIGRKQYYRPQAILLSENPGTVVDTIYVPEGDEFVDFIVLTDNNRGEISMAPERIEQKQRMINGRMRSCFIANKLKMTLKWETIPSRAFAYPGATAIDQATGLSTLAYGERYTTDGGAGGADMYKWYKDHPGSFWVYLAYDNYFNFNNEANPWDHLNKYNERIEMQFSEFSYDIVKRGHKFDFWNVSMGLEEV